MHQNVLRPSLFSGSVVLVKARVSPELGDGAGPADQTTGL